MLLLLIVALCVCYTSGLRTLGIAGAAGRVGRELLNELISKDLKINGEKVRVKALVRDASQLKDIKSKIEVVEVLNIIPRSFNYLLTHSLTFNYAV